MTKICVKITKLLQFLQNLPCKVLLNVISNAMGQISVSHLLSVNYKLLTQSVS